MLMLIFFSSCCMTCPFFFQAEDGIRDDLVTGVQTCALPICPAPAPTPEPTPTPTPTPPSADLSTTISHGATRAGDPLVFTVVVTNAGPDQADNTSRSEERRVGKE